MRHFRLVCFLLVALSLALVQTSCEGRRKPSVLVIAVDRLPFHLSLCAKDAESENSGFQTLCDESIRFTHTLTTSTLSVPALTSLMTGLYPFQHHVRHNADSGLSPQFRTFAESAVTRGMRTAFFSGGAPAWRKTGLQQGFELFDDNVNFSSGRLFRSFQETKTLFENWLRQDVDEKSFASVLYAPDLNFPDTVTETTSGEMRNLSYESQFDEFDETLSELFSFLKKRDRWNDTIVIVVGLNGREISPRPKEVEPVLLNSENTQVSLFVKPAFKPRDEAMHWTIDRNVNLADLGKTLFELVGDQTVAHDEDDFPIVSLMSGLKAPRPEWLESRSLLVESSWPSWQGYGPARAGVLTNASLVIFDEKPRLYNTLTDRMEVSPLSSALVPSGTIQDLANAGFKPWPGLPSAATLLFEIPTLDWLTPARSPAWHRKLIQLSRNLEADKRVWLWAAQSSLEQHDWNHLQEIGKKSKQKLWVQIAERNLGKKNTLSDPCLSLLGKKDFVPADMKKCPDELFLSLFNWVQADVKGENKENARRRFVRGWENFQQDLRILKANAGLGLLWLPASAEENLPSRTSLALALPELKKFTP